MPVGSETLNTFGALLVPALLFGALLTGCGGPGEKGSGEEEPGNGPGAAARPAESVAGPSPGVAQAAAAGIDEASIRERLAHLTGTSPAPLAGEEVTISERGSESGRRAAAQ
jgi:hypothetical protein